MAEEWIKFNVNWGVKVKLNDKGREILKANHLKLLGLSYPYKDPEVDSEGYSKFQMWDLMNEFGSNMVMGLDPPFETTVLLRIEGSA